MPDCTEKQCGSDGCGGMCWSCDDCEETCDPDEQCVSDSQEGGQKGLEIEGSPLVSVYPGASARLRVRLSGGEPGETVDFEFVGYSYVSTLDTFSANTVEYGLAEAILTAGDISYDVGGYFHVRAFHSEVPEGVYFFVHIMPRVPVIRKAIGYGSRNCYVDKSIELKVQLIHGDRDTPIQGVGIWFYVINPPSGGNATVQDMEVHTDQLGRASTIFHSGTVERRYQVVVDAGIMNMERVTFNIDVHERHGCQSDSDCLDDDICSDGTCRAGGLLPDTCNTTINCPAGYFCEDHECRSCPERHELPECQMIGDECAEAVECPVGFFCDSGYCYYDNDAGLVIPDLSGEFFARYYFDLSESIGNVSSSIQGIISSLNQIIDFCRITGIAYIDDILCLAMPAYNPDWINILIDIFENLPAMLGELRAAGDLELVHLNPQDLVSGRESWDFIRIHYANACCYMDGNLDNNCDPYSHQDYPDCAFIDISTHELEANDVGLELESFTGKISADGSTGTTRYLLFVGPRIISIDCQKFTVYLLDRMVQMFIGFSNLDEAMEHIIDCSVVQCIFEENFFLQPVPNIIPTCENIKPSSYELLAGILDQIGAGPKQIEFRGWATITSEGDPLRGTSLGFVDFEENDDGHLEGTGSIIINGDVEGGWYGER